MPSKSKPIKSKSKLKSKIPKENKNTNSKNVSSTQKPKTKPQEESDKIKNTVEFYLDDFGKTLFPLHTNKFLIENGEAEIQSYIEKCLDEKQVTFSFSAQRRVYASKSGHNLRRTVKLDPVAEYYIYDLIFRNRRLFRRPYNTDRTHYGYRFEGGKTIAPTAAYKGFKGAISEYSSKFDHSLSMDVASYFNGIYHHDIVSWFFELGASDVDAEGLGQLLREINSGRSVDCLPQGLYPTKMIGNDFLRFVDNYHDINSEKLIRFMDDIYIFSDNDKNIADDFQVIQKILGDKGLSINPGKTRIDETSHTLIDKEIDDIKKSLLKRRRIIMTVGYDEDGSEVFAEKMIKSPLNNKEIAYIDALLEKPDIEEDDAELILTIMRGHASRVEKRLPDIIRFHPHLAKNVHNFCAHISDKETLAEIILREVKGQDRMPEYKLFWFGAILEDYLMETTKVTALISVIFNHKSATSITKAKILEIPDRRFGLPELRNEFLISGQSDWLAWSSAVGSRALKPATRNHRLKYFGKSSNMNHLISTILMRI